MTTDIFACTGLSSSHTELSSIVIYTSLSFGSTISYSTRIASIDTSLKIKFRTGHAFFHSGKVVIGTTSRFHFTVVPEFSHTFETNGVPSFRIDNGRHLIQPHDFPCRLKRNAYVTGESYTLRQYHTVPAVEQVGIERRAGVGTILFYHDIFYRIRIKEYFRISFLLISTCMKSESSIFQELTGIVCILEESLCVICSHAHQTSIYSWTGDSQILIVFGNRPSI